MSKLRAFSSANGEDGYVRLGVREERRGEEVWNKVGESGERKSHGGDSSVLFCRLLYDMCRYVHDKTTTFDGHRFPHVQEIMM